MLQTSLPEFSPLILIYFSTPGGISLDWPQDGSSPLNLCVLLYGPCVPTPVFGTLLYYSSANRCPVLPSVVSFGIRSLDTLLCNPKELPNSTPTSSVSQTPKRVTSRLLTYNYPYISENRFCLFVYRVSWRKNNTLINSSHFTFCFNLKDVTCTRTRCIV